MFGVESGEIIMLYDPNMSDLGIGMIDIASLSIVAFNP